MPANAGDLCRGSRFHSCQSGLISIVPLAAAGCLAAISTASSRLAHSMMSKPPICSLVSANGPSDTSSSPPRTRTWRHRCLAGAARRRGGSPGRPVPHPRPGSAAGHAPRRGSRSPIRHRGSSACTSWPSFGRDHRAATARTAVRRAAFASGAGGCQPMPVRLAGTGHLSGPGLRDVRGEPGTGRHGADRRPACPRRVPAAREIPGADDREVSIGKASTRREGDTGTRDRPRR